MRTIRMINEGVRVCDSKCTDKNDIWSKGRQPLVNQKLVLFVIISWDVTDIVQKNLLLRSHMVYMSHRKIRKIIITKPRLKNMYSVRKIYNQLHFFFVWFIDACAIICNADDRTANQSFILISAMDGATIRSFYTYTETLLMI